MRAPDYVEPMVGWRVWHVVEREGSFRLVSPLYRTAWPLRRELRAACCTSTEPALDLRRAGRLGHAPPYVQCGCGIYAGHTPAQAVAYLSRFFKPRGDVVHRVLGAVSLWGGVVVCEQGWRASHAYPKHIYVPVPAGRRLFQPGGVKRPLLPADDVALRLADYGVPVELVECATLGELAAILAFREAELGEAA